MSNKPPSVEAVDFSCPYCNAHAAQTWLKVLASDVTSVTRLPFVPDSMPEYEAGDDQDFVEAYDALFARVLSKEIFIEEKFKSAWAGEVYNVHLSKCHSCKGVALWHSRDLLFPLFRFGAPPNPDLDQDIRNDIEEARSILNVSPRGAAALLRLAVQKLCSQLGESGKNIDDDIQSLVNKGMHPHLQQAFDAVRVIGNEAVHPGTLDLRDDHETAVMLIDLINIVAQEMISNKKAISAIYAKLPAGKLKGIENRAKNALKKQ